MSENSTFLVNLKTTDHPLSHIIVWRRKCSLTVTTRQKTRLSLCVTPNKSNQGCSDAWGILFRRTRQININRIHYNNYVRMEGMLRKFKGHQVHRLPNHSTTDWHICVSLQYNNIILALSLKAALNTCNCNWAGLSLELSIWECSRIILWAPQSLDIITNSSRIGLEFKQN